MRVTVKIPLLFFSVLGLAMWLFASQEVEIARRRYREATEEPLVDTAHIVATFIENSASQDTLVAPKVRSVLQQVEQRAFQAAIYEITKNRVDLRIYVTDKQGIVIYDSAHPSAEGEDYSGWRDVALTLRGQYGARSTNEENPNLGKILYVAAPIRRDGVIEGVVSVGKPTKNLDRFLHQARTYTYLLAVGIFIAAVSLSSLLVMWVSRPLNNLTRYARAVRDGRQPQLPHLSSRDLHELGTALEEMRISLEGKEYVERYVTTLTHELKSPLTGIRGAVELLHEDLPRDDRERFLTNIERETTRIQGLIEKLLTLATIQRGGQLAAVDTISLTEVIQEAIDAQLTPTDQSKVKVVLEETQSKVFVRGNRLWLKEAVSNVLSNAVDFSPKDGIVTVKALIRDGTWEISIRDQGPGIPDWAQQRVFERFFSLPRPSNGKRSSGLGLTLVREIMEALGGTVSLTDSSPSGTTVTLSGPVEGFQSARPASNNNRSWLTRLLWRS